MIMASTDRPSGGFSARDSRREGRNNLSLKEST